MDSNKTTILISRFVHQKLEEIKKRNGHSAYDSVLRYLLMKAGEERWEGDVWFSEEDRKKHEEWLKTSKGET